MHRRWLGGRAAKGLMRCGDVAEQSTLNQAAHSVCHNLRVLRCVELQRLVPDLSRNLCRISQSDSSASGKTGATYCENEFVEVNHCLKHLCCLLLCGNLSKAQSSQYKQMTSNTIRNRRAYQRCLETVVLKPGQSVARRLLFLGINLGRRLAVNRARVL